MDKETQDIRKRIMMTTTMLEQSSSDKKYGLRRALAKLEIVASHNIDTMATNGKGIKINPDFAKSLTDKQFVAVLEHEVLHVSLRHQELYKMLDPFKRNHDRFNVAADLEINSHIEDLPEDALFPKDFDLPNAKGTTWYWYNLPNDEQEPEDGQGDGMGDNTATSKSDDSQGEQDVQSQEDCNQDPENSEGQSQKRQEQQERKDKIAKGLIGNVEQPAVDDDGEEVLSEADVQDILKSYGFSSSTEIQELKNDNFNKDIIKKLVRMVKKRQEENYSRQTQSRANKKLFGRTRVKIRPQKFAVYVDISGSMATYWKYFDSFVSQMDAQDVSYKGMFNTRLYDYDPYSFGGGTSMSEVAKHAKDNGYTPIVFTDGEYEDVDMPKDTVYVLIDGYWQGRDYGKNVYKLHKTKHGLK